MRCPSRVFARAAVLSGAVTCGSAFAPGVVVADAPLKPTVDVVLGGGDERSDASLEAALGPSLERLGAIVGFRKRATLSAAEVAGAAQPDSVAVTVWIDLGKAGTSTVYVTAGKNVFARRLDLPRSLDSVALDLLDVVVTSSVETVLSGRPLGVTRGEFARSLQSPVAPANQIADRIAVAPSQPGTSPARSSASSGSPAPGDHPPASRSPSNYSAPRDSAPRDSAPRDSAPRDLAPRDSAPRTSAPRSRSADSESRSPTSHSPTGGSPASPPGDAIGITAAALYQGSWATRTTAMHGPGLRVAGSRGRLWLGLDCGGHFPADVAAGGETIHLTSGAIRLSAGRNISAGSRVALILALGAGLDVTHVRASPTEPDVVPAGAFFSTDFAVRPFAELEGRIGRLMLGIAAGVDVYPIGSTYVIKATPATRPAWTPWRFRPLLALVVGLALR